MADPSSLLSNVSNPLALAGLALIVPIILLYLLKPKPKLILFPSTMFIRFIEKNKRFSSFLQRFIHDPLLIVQILIIALLVLALANPFYMSKQQLREDESIAFVFDASASMQATDGSPTRFDAAINKAKELIGGFRETDEVSIVLAENIPAVISTKSTPEAALSSLGKLKVSDTTTNVGDAIMLAKDILAPSDRKKIVYVLSDFAPSGGTDPQLARKIAQVSGTDVEFIKVGSEGENTGIVSLDAKRASTNDHQLYLTASVRNYGANPRNVTLQALAADKILASTDRQIGPAGEGFFYLAPNITGEQQLIHVMIAGEDRLAIDDSAYANIPAVKTKNVLLLTSAGSDGYLIKVLDSIKNVNVNTTTTFIPHDLSGFDIIILGNFDNKTLPGDFKHISDRVEKGATFIVIGTDKLGLINDPDLWSMLPVDLQGAGSRETWVKVTQEHDILTDVVFDNVVVKKYYNAKERDNSTKTLVGAQAFQNPMMAYTQLGDGNIFYMGINSDPDWSNLYYSSSFPILWSQILTYFTRQKGTESMASLHTGEYLQLPQSLQVETPSGDKIYSASIFLDKAGSYSVYYPDRTDQVPVNLLDSRESNITGGSTDAAAAADYKVAKQDIDVKIETYRPVLALMLLALIVEVILYRRRGLM